MKTIRLTVLSVLVLVSLLSTNQRASAGALSIAAAEQEWYAALVAAERSRLEDLIADDFVYQHPTGKTYSKAAFIQEFISRNVTIDELGPVERTTRDYGPMVVVFGSNTIAGQLGGQRYSGTIRWVNIWRQDAQGWRIVHRNSEILPP